MNKSRPLEHLDLLASLCTLLCSLLVLFYVYDSASSLARLVQDMRRDLLNETYSSLASIRLSIENLRNETITTPRNPIFLNMSDLVQSPEIYEGKLVAVLGEFHNIFTIPEMKLPYNSVLVDGKYQIGVSSVQSVNEGTKVIAIGRLTKGIVKTLGASGWVDSGIVWYLEVIELRRI